MARSSVNERVQIGAETPGALGTPVAATKRLQSLSIDLSPEFDASRFRPKGSKLDTLVTPIKDWTAGDLEGRVTYDELVYPLSSILGAATITPGAGAARTWNWKMLDTTVTPRAFTVENGSADRAHRSAYNIVDELTLTFERDGDPTVSGSTFGRRLEDNITLTPNPTTAEAKPVHIGNVCVYLSTDPATLGQPATKLTRAGKLELKVGGRFAPVWLLDCAIDSFADHAEQAPDVTGTLTAEAGAEGMANLARFRAATTIYTRVEATSPIEAEPGVYHRLRLDNAWKIEDAGDFADDDGLTVIDWSLRGVSSSAAGWTGGGLDWSLTNTITGL